LRPSSLSGDDLGIALEGGGGADGAVDVAAVAAGAGALAGAFFRNPVGTVAAVEAAIERLTAAADAASMAVATLAIGSGTEEAPGPAAGLLPFAAEPSSLRREPATSASCSMLLDLGLCFVSGLIAVFATFFLAGLAAAAAAVFRLLPVKAPSIPASALADSSIGDLDGATAVVPSVSVPAIFEWKRSNTLRCNVLV